MDRCLGSRDGGRAFQAEATARAKALSVQGASINDKPLAMAGALGMSSGKRRAGQGGKFATLRGLAFVSAELGEDAG